MIAALSDVFVYCPTISLIDFKEEILLSWGFRSPRRYLIRHSGWDSCRYSLERDHNSIMKGLLPVPFGFMVTNPHVENDSQWSTEPTILLNRFDWIVGFCCYIFVGDEMLIVIIIIIIITIVKYEYIYLVSLIQRFSEENASWMWFSWEIRNENRFGRSTVTLLFDNNTETGI